ncbi:hypothetical protein FRX31_034865 [Thalictrum thalictroides]|uniref:Uncharacterized protein n=1 Tax=Thalictrum thalictroides TaxID=46969 RepID=A0A7J6UST3_THATH|nr:hypothetical protein FRX31_034865 [Thalictrum thalictroides]
MSLHPKLADKEKAKGPRVTFKQVEKDLAISSFHVKHDIMHTICYIFPEATEVLSHISTGSNECDTEGAICCSGQSEALRTFKVEGISWLTHLTLVFGLTLMKTQGYSRDDEDDLQACCSSPIKTGVDNCSVDESNGVDDPKPTHRSEKNSDYNQRSLRPRSLPIVLEDNSKLRQNRIHAWVHE